MNPKVLFVDDEPSVTKALKNVLFEEDFDVLTANSADEALGILAEATIDVIVSDEKMPGMSGTELLAIVKDKYPDSIRLILSGQSNLDAAIHAINDGEIYRFILKPCNASDLAITIKQALQQHKLVIESNRLLNLTRHQTDIIDELQKAHPGIMDFDIDSDGAILIEEPNENVDELIKQISDEVQKHGDYCTDWYCDKTNPEDAIRSK